MSTNIDLKLTTAKFLVGDVFIMYNLPPLNLKRLDFGSQQEVKKATVSTTEICLNLITSTMTWQSFSNKEIDSSMNYGKWKVVGNIMSGFTEKMKKMMITLELISKQQVYLQLVFNLKLLMLMRKCNLKIYLLLSLKVNNTKNTS